MRVLLPTPDFPPEVGGIQLLLHRLVTHSRHDMRVLTLAAPRNMQSRADDLDVRRGRPHRRHRDAIVELNLITAGHAKSWRPDAILSGHLVTAPAALAAQQLLRVPAVQYVYSDELRRRTRLAGACLSRMSAVIAISRHTRDQALAHGAEPTATHLIVPGVDPPSDAPAPGEPNRDHERPTILTVARMDDRYKGFDVMLRALPLIRERVPQVRWAMIGDGGLRHSLAATASAWGLGDACVFTGRVSDAERDRWFARSHVFALPSRISSDHGGSEGFGIVYLEAGARGLPCVAGAGTGAADAVQPDVSGLIVDPFDHVAVSEAISDLLLDRPRAEMMGAAGRVNAKAHSWGRMASAVDELLAATARR